MERRMSRSELEFYVRSEACMYLQILHPIKMLSHRVALHRIRWYASQVSLQYLVLLNVFARKASVSKGAVDRDISCPLMP